MIWFSEIEYRRPDMEALKAAIEKSTAHVIEEIRRRYTED